MRYAQLSRELKFPIEPNASGKFQDALHAQRSGFNAGLTVALTRQKAAEAGHQMHQFIERGRVGSGLLGLVNK